MALIIVGSSTVSASWPIMSPSYLSLVPGVIAPGLDNPAASGRDNDTDTNFVFCNSYAVPAEFSNATDGGPAPAEWDIENAWAGTWEWMWRRNIDNKAMIPLVSGWLPLFKAIPLRTGAPGGDARASYLGQCSPHPGLFLRGAKPHLNGKGKAHIAHLGSYMGDDTQGVSINNRDCFGSGYEAGVAEDIVLESMDLGLGADELNDAYYNHRRLTIINSFLGDPLHYSFLNPTEDHGFASQVGTGPGGQPELIVVMRSMFANATDRCPVTNARTFTMDNCLVYNCGSITSHATRFVTQNATESIRANVLNTLYVRGPDNSNTLIAVSSSASMPEGSLIHIGGCAVIGWPADEQSDLFRIGPSGILSATIVEDAYPAGWNENSSYQLGQVNAQISPELALRFWQLIAKTVGARPGWRLPQYSIAHRSLDASRRTINGEELPPQFLDTVERPGMTGFPGGWFPVPRYRIKNPKNPGPHWHAPFPDNPNAIVGTEETWGNQFWIPAPFRGTRLQLVGRKVWEKWARLQDWYVKDPRTMPPITAPVAEGVIPSQTGSTSAAFGLDVNDYFDGVAIFTMSAVPGLSIDPVTGVISGTPSAAGSHSVTVTGVNEEGEVSQSFSLAVTGDSEEIVGPASSLDVYDQQIYRIDDTMSIPAWEIEGGTVTSIAGAGWDGGTVRRITPLRNGTPPNTGQGNVGLGQFQMPNDLPIRKLNMRWEQRFGPNWITEIVAMTKWAIMFAGNTPSGDPNGERPMLYLSDMDTQAGDAPSALRRNDLMACAVACGTLKNFEPPEYPGYNWPRGNEDFYFGPTATTIAGKRIVPQGDWYTFEMEQISEATDDHPNGLIRLVVWNRAGEQLTDLQIPWNYDSNWSVGDYLIGVDVMGGGYMNGVTSPSPDNYTEVMAVTFAANRPGLIGPRAGFVE